MWLTAYPEMVEYMKGVADPLHPGGYIAETVTGRIRANATFCSSLNNPFQGLAADGAKMSMAFLWFAALVRDPRYHETLLSLGIAEPPPDIERYLGVSFIHDEVIDEVPLDADLARYLGWKEALMIAGMRLVLPDVTGVKVESQFMINWDKKAKECYDSAGRLVIWTASIKPADKEDPIHKCTKDEIVAACPEGYRPLWSNSKCSKYYGLQPLADIINWGPKEN